MVCEIKENRITNYISEPFHILTISSMIQSPINGIFSPLSLNKTNTKTNLFQSK